MAQYVKEGKRIPRRGEIGLTSEGGLATRHCCYKAITDLFRTPEPTTAVIRVQFEQNIRQN